MGLLLLAMTGRGEDGFRPLFNGHNLDGWVNVNCAPGTWRAINGLIHCTGFPIGELRTDRMYQNFILELEWRHLRPEGNAGVFVWADALTAPGQPFLRGIEVQVLDGREGSWFTSDGDIFPIHGARMVPINGRGGDRAFPIEKRSRPSPEWNHYRIECVDGAISLAVNGRIVTRGHSASPRKGYICLESEGSPVEFRNLRLRELPAREALPPEHIAEPALGFQPLYTGVDGSGWRWTDAVARSWRVEDWILASLGGEDPTPLVSEHPFGDGELIVDWRWPDREQPGDWTRLVRPRGRDLSAVLAPWSDRERSGERPAGQWNRALFRLRGNHLAIEINGRPLGEGFVLTGIPPQGHLVLAPPATPAQWANLFWRRLD